MYIIIILSKVHRINNHNFVFVGLTSEDAELGQLAQRVVGGGQWGQVDVGQIISSELQSVWLSGLGRKNPIRIVLAHKHILLHVATERRV